MNPLSPDSPEKPQARCTDRSALQPQESTVYGPVRSWRFGRSLGIDLLFKTSICSFRCVYCQLGRIERFTRCQDVFVPTAKVVEDLGAVCWDDVDVVTFSGSGEPTLALNLAEVIDHVKAATSLPVIVLTNATLFGDPATRRRVLRADQVVCKLDAATPEMLEQINHPAPGITLHTILEGIRLLREEYPGTLALQSMFMPANRGEAEGLARLAANLRPDEVQVNTPRRPRPNRWIPRARGAAAAEPPPNGLPPPNLTPEQMNHVETILRSALPAIRVVARAAPEQH